MCKKVKFTQLRSETRMKIRIERILVGIELIFGFMCERWNVLHEKIHIVSTEMFRINNVIVVLCSKFRENGHILINWMKMRWKWKRTKYTHAQHKDYSLLFEWISFPRACEWLQNSCLRFHSRLAKIPLTIVLVKYWCKHSLQIKRVEMRHLFMCERSQ